ncbi:MAG: histidine phosphotransferase family protein [Beijerinckiaceae bacterium]|nr:histidine phosphotransferase family protein [Beijerinckiaceae bacterium]MCI0736817.1 histidine phosphotransferase family protein [Beijerinckiaceae bacterium]
MTELERVQQKWRPVLRQDTRQNKDLEPDDDSKKSHLALALDSIDLASLLCSRVCHDISSPVGAIINGLEVLEEEKDAEMRGFALDLIKKSAEQASARLQFCRLAFGAAGSAGASIDTSDAELAARGLFDSERTELKWHIPALLMPKNKVKLILNLCLIAAAAVPRGGVIEVNVSGPEEAARITVLAKGANPKLPVHIPFLLAGMLDHMPSTPQDIQAYYTSLVAKAAGMALTFAAEAGSIALEAWPLIVETEAKPAEF